MARPRINKRTREQRDIDLVFETDLFLKGHGYRDIAMKLNEDVKRRGLDYSLSHQQIFQDMQKALIEWKKQRFENIDDYVQKDLEKLDKMEQSAWDAWEKSCNGKERTKTRKSKRANKLDADVETPDHYGYDENMTETSAGNPRFLDILLNIQQRRAKLLGYDAPIKLDVGGPNRNDELTRYDLKAVPDDILFAAVDAIQNAAYIKEMESKGKVDE